MNKYSDVIIIGGGASGISSAIELKKNNISNIIIFTFIVNIYSKNNYKNNK